MTFRREDEHRAKPSKLILEDETYSIVGAALEVYYKLGSGFGELVYQEALAIEFTLRGIPFETREVARGELQGPHS